MFSQRQKDRDRQKETDRAIFSGEVDNFFPERQSDVWISRCKHRVSSGHVSAIKDSKAGVIGVNKRRIGCDGG